MRFESQMEQLARSLQPFARRVDRLFEARLTALGLDSAARRAAAALMPTAAIPLLGSQGFLPNYAEQVEYHGRRLALLKIPPFRAVQAVEEYSRLLADPRMSAEGGAQIAPSGAVEQWRLWAALQLNHSYYEVAELEARTYQELFEIELASRTVGDLLPPMLRTLAKFCRADLAAVFLFDRKARCWRVQCALPKMPARNCLPSRPEMVRRLQRPACQGTRRRGTRLAILPEWAEGVRSCWSVPLPFEGRMGGVMQFGFLKEYEWLPREVELLTGAAGHCSLATEKARLLQDLAAREGQIRTLAARLVEVEERERKRISAELHDETGQSLMCIRLQLEMLERSLPAGARQLAAGLAAARGLTESTITEIRRVLSSLCPSVLGELGLGAAVRQLVSRFQRLAPFQIRLRVGSLPELGEQVQTSVYRLLQESLNNIARHASATHVNICLDSADGEIRLRVEDDGIGFDVKESLRKGSTFGLVGMMERAALLGGNLQVKSRPGRGTKIAARIPARTSSEK